MSVSIDILLGIFSFFGRIIQSSGGVGIVDTILSSHGVWHQGVWGHEVVILPFSV